MPPRRTRKRPAPADGWRAPANVIGLANWTVTALALVVAVVALAHSCSAARSGERQADTAEGEAARRGLVELSDVNVVYAKTDGEVIDEEGGTRKLPGGLRAPQIDLQVRNRGSGDARIAEAELSVLQSHSLRGCYGTGGGVVVSARYEMTISLDQDPPFTVARPLDFAVPSGKYDRFRLVVGPEGGGSTPWIAVVSLRLRTDDGQDLDAGPLALISPGGEEEFHLDGTRWKIQPPRDAMCQRQNLATVRSVRAIPGLVAPSALASLEKALNALG